MELNRDTTMGGIDRSWTRPPPTPSPTRFGLLPPVMDDPKEFRAWASSFLNATTIIRASRVPASSPAPSPIDGIRAYIAADIAEVGGYVKCLDRCIEKLEGLDEPLLTNYKERRSQVLLRIKRLDKQWNTRPPMLRKGSSSVGKRKEREGEGLAEISIGFTLDSGEKVEEIGGRVKRGRVE